MERRLSDAVDPQPGNATMRRINHSPIRNKINLAEPAQARAWTRRLGLSEDALTAVIDKVGSSAVALTKEVELQRAAHQTSAVPIQNPLS
jgi:hypothetical protein